MTKSKSPAKSTSKAPKPAKPAKPGDPPKPADPSVFTGQAALDKLRLRLSSVAADSLTGPRYNVRLGATAALRLLEEVRQAGLLDRLRKLHSIGEFDASLLDLLPDLAHAAWYIRHRLDQTTALTGEARVPASLLESAHALRAHMLRVLDFHFADDSTVGPQLAYIRRGTGHQDLADDLVGLAALYRSHHVTLASTPLHFRPSDASQAEQHATQILVELGQDQSRQPGEWADLQRRVSALLEPAYEELASAARYLSRQDPQSESRYPRLHAVARTRPQPTKKTPDPTPPPTA